MDLKVIGAGLGRTGTLSLKGALETLGFAPCYHMTEVFGHPGHSELWEAAVRGGAVDWDLLLGGYKATVDWPGCHFWRELSAACPDAKVILSERDAEDWYRSISQTIFEYMKNEPDESNPVRRAQWNMGKAMIAERTFAAGLDKDHVIDVYRRHGEVVRRAIPAERLLVYNVAEGWEPLCHFLGVAVPSTAFPKTNTTDEFRARRPSSPTSGSSP